MQDKETIEAKRMSEKKKAVFLDLDGTLWDREVVPSSAWKAIHKARENGHLVFVNTGRREDSIPQFLWDADLDGYCLATGMDLVANGKGIERHYMDPRKVEKMIAYLKSQGSGYGLETNTIGYDDPKYAFRRKIFYDKEGRKEPAHRMPLSQMPKYADRELVKIIFDSETPFELEETAAKMGFDMMTYKNKFNPTADLGSFFRGEITDARWNKASAMKAMLEALNLNPSDYVITAIGDSKNDLPMMEAADLAVCMGNGTDDAKLAADYVTDSIYADGLYKAFDWLQMF